MISLPLKGFNRSVKKHNVDLGVCCDWLEASVLFTGEDITGSDIVDLLREGEIYSEQSFAWELVDNAFSNIRDRGRMMGDGYPIEIQHGTRLVPRGNWQDYAAYSFCLTLSLTYAYPHWAQAFGTDFTQQGDLFERLTAEAVSKSLTGWTVHPTGWTKSTPKLLASVVSEIAAHLGEATGDLVRWSRHAAKEAGLDLLCFRPFPDGRVGVPVYLFQCASGVDWKTKLKTPDLRIWTKLITFAADPKKAFSMPYALSETDFTYHTNIVDGLLMDRHRLLAPGQAGRNWVSANLNSDLVAWVEPRVVTLPVAASTM